MKKNNFFSLYARARSFRFAFEGIRDFFKSEPNAWIHLVATVIAVDIGFILEIGLLEWVAIIIVIGMVWTAEMFNTALEKGMDLVSPGKDPRVKFVKDVSAGAVLVTAMIALITGLIIFIPKI